MSQHAADVINALPGIEGKSYLELGVYNRATFDRVQAGSKVGVDHSNPGDNVRHMTTNAFFAASSLTFDVIFIDADHSYGQALRDYNSSALALNPGGLILLHDMVPPNLHFAAPEFCGDSYKLLAVLLAAKRDVAVLDGDYGLTAVFGATPVLHQPKRTISFKRFQTLDLPLYNLEDFTRLVAERYSQRSS